jgi:hypothetical protein
MENEVEKDMRRQIEARTAKRHEAARLAQVMVRQIHGDRAEIQKNLELYLDNWAFQHGGLTKENISQAVADCVAYAAEIAERKAQNDWDATSSNLDF